VHFGQSAVQKVDVKIAEKAETVAGEVFVAEFVTIPGRARRGIVSALEAEHFQAVQAHSGASAGGTGLCG